MIFSQAFRNEQFSPAVALFSAAGLIKTTAGIKEEEENEQQNNRKKGDYGERQKVKSGLKRTFRTSHSIFSFFYAVIFKILVF